MVHVPKCVMPILRVMRVKPLMSLTNTARMPSMTFWWDGAAMRPRILRDDPKLPAPAPWPAPAAPSALADESMSLHVSVCSDLAPHTLNSTSASSKGSLARDTTMAPGTLNFTP